MFIIVDVVLKSELLFRIPNIVPKSEPPQTESDLFSEIEMSRTAKNLIGPQLAKHRTHLAMSQSEFAGLCQRSGWDVSRETLAKIESGIRCVTDLELVEISSALKLPLPVLFPPENSIVLARK
jgi:DNA-binding XRE family transcriptional regulator